MKQTTIKKLKEKLEKRKKELEENLTLIAERDPKIEGDWDTKFPDFNKSSGEKVSEEAADEVEEYENLKATEHVLELSLQDVNKALEKMEKGGYGICENCQKTINSFRLEIFPEAKICLKCKKVE